MSRIACAVLVASCLTSCLVVPEDARPQIDASATVASEYNFRGMTNVEKGVVQGEMSVDLPTKMETSSLNFRAFANYDIHTDTGDAWFPDGHGGEPTQIDLQASYSETYRGFDITAGVISYALQNPDDFVNADERGETKEFFVNVARPVAWQLVPSLTLHYDFDEVEDLYANAAVERSFPLQDKWVADARVSVGYSGEDQSDWNYGLPESGWADLRGTAGVTYAYDTHTEFRSTLNASTMIDEDLRDWFDLIDIDADTVWLTVGVHWLY